MTQMSKRRRFDDITKKAALEDIRTGMKLAEAAEKYGASIGSLQLWKKQFGFQKVTNTGSPAARLQEITRQLANLEDEKESIQRNLRAEQALPQIRDLILNMDDATITRLQAHFPDLANKAIDLRNA